MNKARIPATTASALAVPKKLFADFHPEFAAGRGTGHHHAGGGGNNEGRNLAHQTVADAEQTVELSRIGDTHSLLHHADEKPAQKTNGENDQTRHGIAANKFGRTVHGAVEVAFSLDALAPLARLRFIDEAGVQIGVDGHLFPRHRVEGEARGDFSDAGGAFGNHDEIDNHQDHEYDKADDIVARHDKLTKRCDHPAGCGDALLHRAGESNGPKRH